MLRRETAQARSPCRDSRTPAAHGASAFNRFLLPDPDHLLQVSVVLGFRRARLLVI